MTDRATEVTATRKGRKSIVLAAAALAMALGVLPARSRVPGPPAQMKDAQTSTCQNALAQHGYLYCGTHWPLTKLPILFTLVTDGMPSSLRPIMGMGSSQFRMAAEQAASAWNRLSRITGRGPKGSCPAATLVCIDSVSTTGTVNPAGGGNIIRWDHLGQTGQIGTAYVSSSSGHITDVDIVLNSDYTWYWGDPQTLATGTATGAVAFFCAVCPDQKDVQSILTHEIGHALGLLHPNPGSPSTWPEDPQDAADYNLVMYQRYYPNNATQRQLQWGDIAGLNAMTQDVANENQ